jgi:hypothetical protein
MENHRYTNLESWTESRLSELRQVAATESQLRKLAREQKTLWIAGIATRLGQTMITWGKWLQRQGNHPVSAAQ